MRPDRSRLPKALDPAIPQIDLQLGMALFLSEDIDAAEQSFAAARAAGTTGPEIDFYEALIALSRNTDPAGAAASLERAGRDRPNTLDPAASYYAGLAWRSAQDEERARAALERVIAEHPDTVWADSARKALDQTQAAGLAVTSRPWASLRLGLEFGTRTSRSSATASRRPTRSARSPTCAACGASMRGRRSRTWAAASSACGLVHRDRAHRRDDYDLQYPYAGRLRRTRRPASARCSDSRSARVTGGSATTRT